MGQGAWKLWNSQLGVIHKPRGQILKAFYPIRLHFTPSVFLSSKVVIRLTPSPKNVHVVYGCPLPMHEEIIVWVCRMMRHLDTVQWWAISHKEKGI